MSKWATEWSGRYPNLCSGKWSLYRDGVLLDVDIPFNGESQFDSKPAYTSGCWHSVGIYHEGDEWSSSTTSTVTGGSDANGATSTEAGSKALRRSRSGAR